MHLIYLIHEFHNLSWITEINELFHDILIYWDAPVWEEDMTAAGNEAETSTSSPRKLSFYFYLTLFYVSFTLQRPFWRLLVFYYFCAIFRCSVLFWFQISPHKLALSCFSCVFCALSWTVMSLLSPFAWVSLYFILFSLLASCTVPRVLISKP